MDGFVHKQLVLWVRRTSHSKPAPIFVYIEMSIAAEQPILGEATGVSRPGSGGRDGKMKANFYRILKVGSSANVIRCLELWQDHYPRQAVRTRHPRGMESAEDSQGVV